MNIDAIIQARMGSTRLPGKMMMPLGGIPAIQRVVDRVRNAKHVGRVIVATTQNSEEIIDHCITNQIEFMLGSEFSPITRTLVAIAKYDTDVVVDITGDCPLIDPKLIDQCIKIFLDNTTVDYVSNCVPIRSYPDGMDVQVYKSHALQKVKEILSGMPISHVGWNIPQNVHKRRCRCIQAPTDLSWPDLRLTLDTKEDYELIDNIYSYFLGDWFDCRDIISYLQRNPELLDINKNVRTKSPEEG